MDTWLSQVRDAIAEASGIPADELELDNETVRELLDLARIAAHESGDRTNAPLLCFLLGRASARGGLSALSAAVRTVA